MIYDLLDYFHFSSYSKYSVLPSPPFIGEFVKPTTDNPVLFASCTMFLITFLWTFGFLTIPLLLRNSRPHSNCGFIRTVAKEFSLSISLFLEEFSLMK